MWVAVSVDDEGRGHGEAIEASPGALDVVASCQAQALDRVYAPSAAGVTGTLTLRLFVEEMASVDDDDGGP